MERDVDVDNDIGAPSARVEVDATLLASASATFDELDQLPQVISGDAHRDLPTSEPESAKGRLSSSMWLFVANLMEAILPFIRNIALARIIKPSDFGFAISFAVVIGLVEVLTDFGLPIYAVRRSLLMPVAVVMGTLQSIALIRATALGTLLALLSPFIARAFHAPHATWAYALLGLVGCLRGFENLGVKEMMRAYVFWREATVIGAAQAAGLVVAIVTAMATHDFTCMVWSMLTTSLTTVALSHLLSPQPYRLRWNTMAAKDALAFGRPLLVNGAAVSLNMCDRLLVGTLLGASALAIYNVAYGTATLPRTVLTKFLTSAFLPLFVEHRESGREGSGLINSWTLCLSGLAFFYALGLCLMGDMLLALVFGKTYAPSRLFMCLAGMSVFVKFLMLLPVPPAYAAGDTRLVTLGSVLSALSVLPAAACLVMKRNLDLFICVLAIAEFGALIFFVRYAVRKQAAATPATTWALIVVPYLTLAALAGIALTEPHLAFGVWSLVRGLVILAAALFYGRRVISSKPDLMLLIAS